MVQMKYEKGLKLKSVITNFGTDTKRVEDRWKKQRWQDERKGYTEKKQIQREEDEK
jgi:hypothetical protein